MRGVLRLGLRLAGVGATPAAGRYGWVRSAMVALSATVGSTLLLGVAAIARSETALNPATFVSVGLQVLLASVVAIIAVTVLVLAATAGRLSAALRDRRLANLRLLGLSPFRTRLVAAVETGAAATVGTLLGCVVFIVVRPLLLAWQPAGREWTAATLWPDRFDAILVVLVVPLAVIAVSVLPQRMGNNDTMSSARRAEEHRLRAWRLLPLLLGLVLAATVIVGSSWEPFADQLAWVMFAGMVALGFGVILAVPIFVRLLANMLVARADRATLLIAGRRLQAQPAAMSRVVAGLLIGLFIVTGARALVVAFEDTPQYQAEALMHTTGQVGSVRTTLAHLPALQQQATALDGVRATATLPRLGTAWCGKRWTKCLEAVVGTCADLRLAVPGLNGCRNDQPQWLLDPHTWRWPGAMPASLDWHQLVRGSPMQQGRASGLLVSLPTPQHQLNVSESSTLGAHIFIPTTLLPAGSLSQRTDVELLIAAKPGLQVRNLITALLDSEYAQGGSSPGTSYYDFVSGLRTLVWAIATVILAVGLLSFTIAAIDRAVSRREEVMSLQLAGVSPTMLRRTQWIEATLPLATGTVLAIMLGLLAGASYLAYGGILDKLPWWQTGVLAGIAVLSASFVAALTVVASSPSIRPELIRTE